MLLLFLNIIKYKWWIDCFDLELEIELVVFSYIFFFLIFNSIIIEYIICIFEVDIILCCLYEYYLFNVKIIGFEIL